MKTEDPTKVQVRSTVLPDPGTWPTKRIEERALDDLARIWIPHLFDPQEGLISFRDEVPHHIGKFFP